MAVHFQLITPGLDLSCIFTVVSKIVVGFADILKSATGFAITLAIPGKESVVIHPWMEVVITWIV
ncbi:hypothetical protein D3C86_1930900 [compost metagenome]